MEYAINKEHLNKINDEMGKIMRRSDSALDYVPTQYITDFVKSIIPRWTNPERRRPMAGKEPVKIVAKNNKAYHDYFIEEKFEAGIELAGTEVKSIRQGNVNLKDSFCIIKDGQLSVLGMHISPYEKGNIFNKDPRRTRRLLMHKREILRLFGRIKQDGYSLIPLAVYFKGPRVKLEIGLAKGKKLYDKRESAARKDAKREMDRAMKTRNR